MDKTGSSVFEMAEYYVSMTIISLLLMTFIGLRFGMISLTEDGVSVNLVNSTQLKRYVTELRKGYVTEKDKLVKIALAEEIARQKAQEKKNEEIRQYWIRYRAALRYQQYLRQRYKQKQALTGTIPASRKKNQLAKRKAKKKNYFIATKTN
ncbi:MAG: hypothetical protein OEZ36_04590 [Spirochaetota bacterium]|nr:hypothetical protein [Spirochaetota bacterium]